MSPALKIALLYTAAVSIVTIIITVYDKIAAKKRPRHRVPERTLLLLAMLGGGLAEYAALLAIRHKTRRKKFMIGLPVIIFAHAAAVWLYFRFTGQ